MVMTVFAVPVMFDTVKVNAETSSSSKTTAKLNEKKITEALSKITSSNELTPLYNPGSSMVLPSTIYDNKAFSATIKTGDESIINNPDDEDWAFFCDSVVVYDSNIKILSYIDTSKVMPKQGYYSVSGLNSPYMGNYYVTALFYLYEYDASNYTWYPLVDGDNEYIIDGVTENVNIKGLASFNANKGKFKTSGAAKTITYNLQYGTLPTMQKRKGYTFAGWYSGKTAGTLIKNTSIVKVIKSTTFYAQWKYKITLNANKGKIGKKKTKKKSVTSGLKYGSLSIPKRSGNNFAGWYTKKSGGTWINASKYVSNPSKHTLYAHWVKKSKYATKSQYKAVKNGMTYSEVKRIFGRAGRYSSNASSGNIKAYAWLTKTGRNGAAIIFENGKVTHKGWV